MNSKTLIFVIIAAATYGIFIIAHERFDRPHNSLVPPSGEGDDVSDILRPLMTEGHASFASVRAELEKRKDGSEKLVAFLPREDEPWLDTVRSQVVRESSSVHGKVELAISEPRGLETGPRPGLLLRRELPGRAWLRVFALEAPEEGSSFEAPVNQWQGFPEDFVFEAGKKYGLELRSSEDGEVVDRSEFELMDAAGLSELQSAMQTLKQHVADQRLRFFLQASCAMSRGLYSEATEIILKRMPRAEIQALEYGLIARLAYLYDRRGEYVSRDRALALLRERP